MSEQIPPTVGTSAPHFSPGIVTAVNDPCSWSPGSIVYYATDGITQIRLDHPDSVSTYLRGRERVIAAALVDYARELLSKAQEAA